ncbi:MAG: hypothetical protein MUO34_10730 [Ignavibacteriaceae bacterium]|nr:hypothetical protein [Ignavibacteriaceae bacterium]
MFARQKKNKSGVISIQIISKNSGKYKVIKTIGSSNDRKKIDKLFKQAKQEIDKIQGQEQFNFEINKEKDLVDTFFNSIDEIKLSGPELLLGKLFDQIGFNHYRTSYVPSLSDAYEQNSNKMMRAHRSNKT